MNKVDIITVSFEIRMGRDNPIRLDIMNKLSELVLNENFPEVDNIVIKKKVIESKK